MPSFKRSSYLLFTLEELGIGASAQSSSFVITSPLSGQHLLTSFEELERLRQVPSGEWSTEAELVDLGFDGISLERYTTLAILLSDGSDSQTIHFRALEVLLGDSHWPPLAAAYHLLNHHQESQNAVTGRRLNISLLEMQSEARGRRYLDKHGLPPPTFFVPALAGEPEFLPTIPENISPVESVLLSRRTCRSFQDDAFLQKEELAAVLRWTFAPVASRLVAEQVELLLKTSPSGGSLHPIEAFPILFCCEGARPGVYHYRGDLHAISLIQEMPEGAARKLAVRISQGQEFVGSCSAVVVLVARFDRNFWKYRERENSYAVVLQDAGHLSQTFQLIACDRKLASFYTAAIDSHAIVEMLNLRYPAEAPIGILGLGREAPTATLVPPKKFALRRPAS